MIHAGRSVRGLLASTVAVVLTSLVVGVAAPATAALRLSPTPAVSWRVDGRVYATLIVKNTVYVGGDFRNAISSTGQTVPRARLAAFSLSTGALRRGFRADAGGTVRALAAGRGFLYIGGAFGALGGQAHAGIGRVKRKTGAADASYTPAANGNVRALAVGPDGIYVGGTFTAVNRTPRNLFAKLNKTSGRLKPGFSASVSGAGVYGLARNPVSGAVYVAGQLSAIGGQPRTGIAAINPMTGAVLPVVFAGSVNPTLGVDVSTDGTMVFGAGATVANRASGWNANGGGLWQRAAGGDIQAIAYWDGVVYFGFHDNFGGDKTVKLRAVDARTGVLDPAFVPHFNRFWGVFAIDASGRGLVVGGEFTTVSGVPAGYWARFLAR